MKNEMSLDLNPMESSRPTRARWMVVDDNHAVLDFLASLLESLGIAEVHRFENANEALAAFNAAPEQFQFVITDLEMPGMNGIELCRRLRAISPEVKIVLATGSAVANEAGARRCGFCGMLAKPFPAAALWRVMEAAAVTNTGSSSSKN
jgi:CheY-like chemotaxis protein